MLQKRERARVYVQKGMFLPAQPKLLNQVKVLIVNSILFRLGKFMLLFLRYISPCSSAQEIQHHQLVHFAYDPPFHSSRYTIATKPITYHQLEATINNHRSLRTRRLVRNLGIITRLYRPMQQPTSQQKIKKKSKGRVNKKSSKHIEEMNRENKGSRYTFQSWFQPRPEATKHKKKT